MESTMLMCDKNPAKIASYRSSESSSTDQTSRRFSPLQWIQVWGGRRLICKHVSLPLHNIIRFHKPLQVLLCAHRSNDGESRLHHDGMANHIGSVYGKVVQGSSVRFRIFEVRPSLLRAIALISIQPYTRYSLLTAP